MHLPETHLQFPLEWLAQDDLFVVLSHGAAKADLPVAVSAKTAKANKANFFMFFPSLMIFTSNQFHS